jgi:outer membrane protein assembly factor BamB
MADTFKYRAFISYSSRDRDWADWLFNGLETYRLPWKVRGTAGRDGPVPSRLFPIFRDRDELPASADLSTQIETALRESACLVVICSPRSAVSRWVNEEILTFKRLGRHGRIIAIIVDGEPNAADKAGITPEQECFPPGLRFRLGDDGELSTQRVEPVAADAREQGDGKANAKLKVIAGILGINYDALKRREDRRRLVRTLAAASIAAMAVGAASLYTWQQIDSGYLFAESQPVNSTIAVDRTELGARIANLKLRSGKHDLQAWAPDHFADHRLIKIPRQGVATTRFWLEDGFEWAPYTSPAIQSGLILIPGADDTILVHNELTQIIFLSTSSGKIVSKVDTPAGNMRAFLDLELGGDIGRVIVSGFDAERNGPDVLVLRAKSSAEQLWHWQGPASGLEKSDSIAVVAVPQSIGPAALAIAGRDGHVYLLDGRTGSQIANISVSPTPLPSPPQLFVTERDGTPSIAMFYRQADASSDNNTSLHAAFIKLPSGEIVWRHNYGTSWQGVTAPLTIAGAPQVVAWNSRSWQIIDVSTGDSGGAGGLPGPLFGGPVVAAPAPSEEPALIFQFTDPALNMLAVRASDASVLWRGPNNLSPLRQPRLGNSVPRTPDGLLLVNLVDALAAVDPKDGRVRWQIAGHPIDVLVADWNGDGKDEILVGMSGVGLLCLDGEGKTLWTLHMETRDVRPWALVKPKQGGSTSDIVVQRHASFIGVVHGPRVLWEQQATAPMQATPVVVETDAKDEDEHGVGKSAVVEVAQWGGDVSLRAFDSQQGNVLWSAGEAIAVNRGITLADLDGDGQMKIVGLGRRPGVEGLLLLSYRPDTGEVTRSVPVAVAGWLSCAPAVADFRGIGRGDVAFTTWDDRSIVMIDGKSGEILWRYKTGGPNMQGISAGDLDGDGKPDVVALSFDGNAYGLRGSDGSLLWKQPIAGGGWSNPVVAQLEAKGPPQVLVVSGIGRLHVLSAQSGEEIWTPDITGAAKVAGHPIVIDKMILAPLGTAGVVAFDWTTRTEVWRSPAGFPVIASPAVASFGKGKVVVFGAVTGDLFALNLTDGRVIWRDHIVSELIEADPVVTDLDHDGFPDILIAGHDFKLHALRGAGTIGYLR